MRVYNFILFCNTSILMIQQFLFYGGEQALKEGSSGGGGFSSPMDIFGRFPLR